MGYEAKVECGWLGAGMSATRTAGPFVRWRGKVGLTLPYHYCKLAECQLAANSEIAKRLWSRVVQANAFIDLKRRKTGCRHCVGMDLPPHELYLHDMTMLYLAFYFTMISALLTTKATSVRRNATAIRDIANRVLRICCVHAHSGITTSEVTRRQAVSLHPQPYLPSARELVILRLRFWHYKTNKEQKEEKKNRKTHNKENHSRCLFSFSARLLISATLQIFINVKVTIHEQSLWKFAWKLEMTWATTESYVLG